MYFLAHLILFCNNSCTEVTKCSFVMRGMKRRADLCKGWRYDTCICIRSFRKKTNSRIVYNFGFYQINLQRHRFKIYAVLASTWMSECSGAESCISEPSGQATLVDFVYPFNLNTRKEQSRTPGIPEGTLFSLILFLSACMVVCETTSMCTTKKYTTELRIFSGRWLAVDAKKQKKKKRKKTEKEIR